MKNTNFWLDEKSPKQFFKEMFPSEYTKVSFWDIFRNYEPVYVQTESIEDKRKKEEIVSEIIERHLKKTPLTEEEIETLIYVIQEKLLPIEEQDIADISQNMINLAIPIVQQHLQALRWSERAICFLLDFLEESLLQLNQEYILNNEIALYRQQYEKGLCSKQQYENIIESFEWDRQQINKKEEFSFENEEELEADNFEYPHISLATSTTFFGFNGDAGNLSYQEQEEIAQEKYTAYKNEIAGLLNQQPNKELAPKKTANFEDETTWQNYYDLAEKNPFIYLFDGAFTLWQKEEKILFLSMTKEDKELPYEISIGGLTKNKYLEIIKKYNILVD